MQKYSETVLDRNGNVVVGATVTVTTYPAGSSATVYSSNAVGSNANPLTTDSNGYFEFWTTNGRYSLTISKTGITTRTVSNILIQDTTVSVTEYGAKGDGATDDRAAIQSAHDAVYAAGGGTVFFPPGTFLVGGAANGNGIGGIAFRDNVQFVGSGRGATIIKNKNSSGIVSGHAIFEPYDYGHAVAAVGYYSHNNSFRAFSINGNIANQSAAVFEGITVSGVKDALIFDVEVYSCGECGIYAQVSNTGTDAFKALIIDSCISHGNTADGFQYVGAIVSNCYAYSNTGFGFNSVANLVTGSGDAVYSQTVNCRAESNTGGGFGASLQQTPHIHSLFSNCVAYLNSNFGFYASLKYTEFENCVALLNAYDGFAIQADHCSIIGGRALNNGTSATGATNYRAGIQVTGSVNYCSIRGVTLTDERGGGSKTQQYAIAFTNPGSGGNNIVANCICTGNVNATPYQLGTATDWITRQNIGINPVGAFGAGTNPSNPAVPATTVTVTNTYGYDVLVCITGGTVTAVKINTVATGLIAGSFVLGPAETISITFSVAPTWQWFGL